MSNKRRMVAVPVPIGAAEGKVREPNLRGSWSATNGGMIEQLGIDEGFSPRKR